MKLYHCLNCNAPEVLPMKGHICPSCKKPLGQSPLARVIEMDQSSDNENAHRPSCKEGARREEEVKAEAEHNQSESQRQMNADEGGGDLDKYFAMLSDSDPELRALASMMIQEMTGRSPSNKQDWLRWQNKESYYKIPHLAGPIPYFYGSGILTPSRKHGNVACGFFVFTQVGVFYAANKFADVPIVSEKFYIPAGISLLQSALRSEQISDMVIGSNGFMFSVRGKSFPQLAAEEAAEVFFFDKKLINDVEIDKSSLSFSYEGERFRFFQAKARFADNVRSYFFDDNFFEGKEKFASDRLLLFTGLPSPSDIIDAVLSGSMNIMPNEVIVQDAFYDLILVQLGKRSPSHASSFADNFRCLPQWFRDGFLNNLTPFVQSVRSNLRTCKIVLYSIAVLIVLALILLPPIFSGGPPLIFWQAVWEMHFIPHDAWRTLIAMAVVGGIAILVALLVYRGIKRHVITSEMLCERLGRGTSIRDTS